MLNRRERTLLIVFGWTIVLAAVALFVGTAAAPLAGLPERVALMEQQLLAFGGRSVDSEGTAAALAATDAAIVEEEKKFYRSGEIDPYTFGVLVRDLLVREGLIIQRYQTVTAGGQTLLEFAVTGEGRSLFSFFRRVSHGPKYWPISLLSIRAPAQGQIVQAVFRIRYEVVDETGL